jgi:hypothetical protein
VAGKKLVEHLHIEIKPTTANVYADILYDGWRENMIILIRGICDLKPSRPKKKIVKHKPKNKLKNKPKSERRINTRDHIAQNGAQDGIIIKNKQYVRIAKIYKIILIKNNIYIFLLIIYDRFEYATP